MHLYTFTVVAFIFCDFWDYFSSLQGSSAEFLYIQDRINNSEILNKIYYNKDRRVFIYLYIYLYISCHAFSNFNGRKLASSNY